MISQTSANRLTSPSLLTASFGVLFASICFGLVPYFSRNLTDQGLAPHAVAFFRYVIAAIFLLPVLMMQIRFWRVILWGMSAGAAMGLGWVAYVSALRTAPVSTLGVIYMTYPVFTVFLSWLLFGGRPTQRAVIAAGLIVLAAVIAGNPIVGPASQLPILIMSLAAPLGFGYAICILVHRLSPITPLARIASVSLGSVLALGPLMLLSEPMDVIPQTPSAWVLIGGIAVVAALIPQLIYTVYSPLIGASRSAIIGSVELPTMFAVSVIAFGEHLTQCANGCVFVGDLRDFFDTKSGDQNCFNQITLKT